MRYAILERAQQEGDSMGKSNNEPQKAGLSWNNPKASTYNNEGVMVLYVANNRHVQRADLTINSFYESGAPEGREYDNAEQKANAFIATYGDNIDATDRATIDAMLRAVKRHQERKQAVLQPVTPAVPPTTL